MNLLFLNLKYIDYTRQVFYSLSDSIHADKYRMTLEETETRFINVNLNNILSRLFKFLP